MLLLGIVLALATTFGTGCDENVDPTDPEGAYNIYINSLWANDAEGVWDRLAPTTRGYFQTQYENLVEMDETIRRYLPATDHKIARQQAGSILTDEVQDGKGLFLKVFQPQGLNATGGHKVGALVDEIKINEDKTQAELTTLGGDTFYLTKGTGEGVDPNQWYVMLVRSSEKVKSRMQWLDSNQSALQQTVEDLIAEERTKRESIIAELMRLENPGTDEGGEGSEQPEAGAEGADAAQEQEDGG